MGPLAERILEGDVRALARAATAIENRRPEALSLLEELFPRTGRATLIGVTGAPGAGKSTLVDQLARALRAEGRTVGIVAVDPSSPFSGGAILGDRIRMQRHAGDAGVFIRSVATRGASGGVSAATGEMIRLLDGAGRDAVLVETVGVGQDQTEIAALAPVTAVVLAPGMGDDVQTLKAGIMEIANVFVVNKSDQPDADRVAAELRSALELTAQASRPAVVQTAASQDRGIAELWEAIEQACAGALPRHASKGD